MSNQAHWWQSSPIYQIYPRSFMDGNGDGIGDLRGIISKLDYVKDLGFEAIWFSPFFSSPQQDFGYDVSDYYDIAAEYGSLDDAQDLIDEVHARGMRVIFDLVLNHTSDQHPWFQASRSSRDSPRRDWYIWCDGRGRRPPTNWKAIPGGSGWNYEKRTDQWYYANFLPFQPDLNYRNPAVKEAMFDVVRHWLDKGVDGFRLDIFHSIYKDGQFRDNPFSFTFAPSDFTAGFFQRWLYNLNQPETVQLAKELRAVVEGRVPERCLIGEVFADDATLRAYLGDRLDGLNLIFLWDLLAAKPDGLELENVIRRYETRYPAPYTPVYVFGNHDQRRVLSKIGNDIPRAKLLALLQFTVRGVPVTYYGDEIGMLDGDFLAREAKDPIGQRFRRVPQFILNLLGAYVNRDGCRTPMQWNDGENAGFCPPDVEPWLPVHENRHWANVETQLRQEDSLLNVYRALLRLRRESEALQRGSVQLIDTSQTGTHTLGYRRTQEDEALSILINFSETPQRFKDEMDQKQLRFAVGSVDLKGDTLELAPCSGAIVGDRG